MMANVFSISNASDQTFAIVNGTPIFASEFNSIFSSILEQYKQNFSISEQTEDEINKLKNVVLDKKIESLLLKEEIKNQKIRVSKKEIQNVINDIKKRYKDENEFKTIELEKESLSMAEFERRLNEEIEVKKLVDRFVIANLVPPTEAEIKDVYDKAIVIAKSKKINLSSDNDSIIVYIANALKIASGEHVKLRQIFINCPKGSTNLQVKKVQNKIEFIKKELQKKTFAEVARLFSEDFDSKQRSGDVGIIAKGVLPSTIDNIIFSMKVGDYNKEPVKTDIGYIFFKVEGKFASKDVTFNDVKNDIAEILYQNKLQKAYSEYVNNLKSKANIKINKIW
jgi:parvulin-like peptidyl-prolyl isomerase